MTGNRDEESVSSTEQPLLNSAPPMPEQAEVQTTYGRDTASGNYSHISSMYSHIDISPKILL